MINDSVKAHQEREIGRDENRDKVVTVLTVRAVTPVPLITRGGSNSTYTVFTPTLVTERHIA